MRTNAWVTIERSIALTWRDWIRWSDGDQLAPEPSLTNWEKKAARRLADMEYIFKRFLRPTILTKVWIMLSVYDVTVAEVNSGYSQLGDAESGGDFACAGFWEWTDGDTECSLSPVYTWRPNQVLLFMPPTIEGETEVPATEVRDVNLLFGQPPRELPS